MNAPAGFEPLFRTSPVLELIGPLFSKGTLDSPTRDDLCKITEKDIPR